MGAAIPNPDVKAERAINYEVGAETQAAPGVKLSGAAFYSDVKDALIQIPVIVPGFGAVNQTRNAGKGRYYGAEASVDAKLAETLDAGGNVTWIHRKLTDPTNPAFRPQGVPDWKLFAYANWRPLPKLTVRPNIEYADQRWTVTTATPLAGNDEGLKGALETAKDFLRTPDLKSAPAVADALTAAHCGCAPDSCARAAGAQRAEIAAATRIERRVGRMGDLRLRTWPGRWRRTSAPPRGNRR
jgi:outer membrane receptor protein involved in Fe transport